MKSLLLSTCLLLGLSLAFNPTITLAQPVDTFGNNGDNRDPFSRASNGDTTGLLNLINQAQLNSKNNPSSNKDRQDELNSATEDFRARQLQLLHNSSRATSKNL